MTRKLSEKVAGCLGATATVAAATTIAYLLMDRSALADVAMIQLLGVVIVALRFGSYASLLAAGLSVLCFDFFFLPPYYSLAISAPRHLVTAGVMLVVAIVVGNLGQRVRRESKAARDSHRRTSLLHEMNRELAQVLDCTELAVLAARHLESAFDGEVVVFLKDTRSGRLAAIYRSPARGSSDPLDTYTADLAWETGREIGLGTTAVPSSRGRYVLLTASHEKIGVLEVRPRDQALFERPDERALLDACATQISIAVERARLLEEAQHSHDAAERETMRNALLSSVSHDLKTPLAIMTGSASTLLMTGDELAPETRRRLLQDLYDEGERLGRVVRNLLELTRLESGVTLNREWQPLEGIVGAAVGEIEPQLHDREIRTWLAHEIPALYIDGMLIEQVLLNLLDNALKYGREGPIDVSAGATDRLVIVAVDDTGPGIPPGEEQRIFEKFHRLHREGRVRGAGLGLAICRAILDAHGGKIWAENRPTGGASFRFSLPLEEGAPVVPNEASGSSQ